MLKHDKEILWKPGRIYIPAWQFSGLDYEATTAADIKSVGTGTPSDVNLNIGEVNTSGITGINFTTADNSINTLIETPADLDIAHPIYTRVFWTANNTSGSVDWEMFYKVFIAGTTVLGSAEAATAFDGVGAAQTMAGVAYTLMRTPTMRINGNKIPDTTDMIQFKVQMHALVTITSVAFIGLGIRYTPKRLQGNTGMLMPAKPATYIASNKYAS